MDAYAARALFATARVARLATVGADGRPHVVPITFALDGDTLYTAVDHKPKRTTRLRRLENVAVHPGVSVLADHYDEQDWSALWWVRADGVARILAPNDPQRARVAALLQARYEQYRRRPPTGPAIAIAISRWSGWRAARRSARLIGRSATLGAVGVRMQIWPAMPREQAGDSTTTPSGHAASQRSRLVTSTPSSSPRTTPSSARTGIW